MDGLECQEILYSELEFSGRIDAEYYQKIYLEYEDMILSCDHDELFNVANFIIGPFGSAYDTSNYTDIPDYRYVRGQDVKPFVLKETEPRYMTKEDYDRLSKYALKPRDVLVSVVGTLGNACIVKETDVPAIFSCKSTVIRANGINPYYLTAYLNCKYGRALLLRKERGAIQKGLNLDDLRMLQIPVFSDSFQSKIEKIILSAEKKMMESKELYKDAERILNAELGLNDYIEPNEVYSTKSFSESFGLSARLDAEYYQKKYDDYEAMIKSYGSYTTIENEFELVKEKCFFDKDVYNYTEIGDISVGNGKFSYTSIPTEELPANAKTPVCVGDVLVSKVRPNRGAVSIIDTAIDNHIVSGAFSVLRAKGSYQKELLFVLLRTKLYRDWLLKYNVGTSYPTIKDEDVMRVKIPILPQEIKTKVMGYVYDSNNLIDEAQKLLSKATQMMEIAIEYGESEALK